MPAPAYRPPAEQFREVLLSILDSDGIAPLPADPTSALPATEEKIAVMAGRARRHESLFHPLDARRQRGSGG